MLYDKSLAIAFRFRVLNLWFSNNRWPSNGKVPARSAPTEEGDIVRWFSPSNEFDQQIRKQFQDDLSHLIKDEYRYPNDLTQPEHLLACIIALDQFPRNMYRFDARAFAFDSKARELSEQLITHQGDKQLPYVERIFVYLPFEHSENLEDQEKYARYIQDLYDEAKNDLHSSEGLLGFLREFIDASQQHREIIKRFGRFPHRNAALKRASLENEEIYLRDGGERFGQ